jgi:CDP-4-dehydro-6-deoxyglucose reductase, E1
MTNSSKHFLNQLKVGYCLLFARNLAKQPYFQDIEYRIVGDLTNTDVTMNQTLWLGIYPALGEQQLGFITEKIKDFFTRL